MSVTVPPDERDVVEEYSRPSLGSSTGWDEMVDAAHGIREPWREISSLLSLLGRPGLTERRRTVARLLEDDGVTYRPFGVHEQPWLLDPVPMLLDEAQWARLEPALRQRAELLDAILTDLYGERRLLTERLVPAEVVFGHPGFLRAVDQVRLPGPRQLFLTATDLARGTDGTFVVLSDRTQAPSGAGYAMENRRVVSRTLPGLYRDTRIQRLGPFFHSMRLALQQLAPTTSEVPRVVLLTPGARSETAFDQAFLSSLLGFPLVVGSDLTVRDGAVWQRSLGRLEPVDVILRRVDAAYCDPLELRPDSHLGVPGLVEAARLGNVSIANGLGSGVLENPALFGFLPRLCEVLLGEPLQMPSVPTWWCGEPAARDHVITRMHELVIKPVGRRTTQTSRFGWELTSGQREELARRIEAEPGAWVGQQAVVPSTTPSVGHNGLDARPVLIRTFAVAQNGSYRVLDGGLTRIGPTGSTSLVSNQHGALAKDFWVLSGAADEHGSGLRPDDVAPEPVASAISPRVAEDLFWLGRYAERAEDLARLIRITDNRWRDAHPGADPALTACVQVLTDALAAITAALPADGDGPTDPSMLLTLVTDRSATGTLAHDVHRMRELAHAVRDQLSNDTWVILGELERGLIPLHAGPGPSVAGPGRADRDVSTTLVRLLESLLAFSGLAAESMVRDAGWYFMDAGRRLERALQVCRVLKTCLAGSRGPDVDELVHESVLIAAESIITHRRRYRARAGVETILELLLTDRDNPRSVAYQLDTLTRDLRRIPGAATPAEADGTPDLLRRIGARLLDADVAALGAGAVGAGAVGRPREELTDLLDVLICDLHALATWIEATHFVQPTVRQLQAVSYYDTQEAM